MNQKEIKICTECSKTVTLAYGNIDGRHWFCVDCLVRYPLRADLGLVDMYFRYSTPYYGFPRLTKAIRNKLMLNPVEFTNRQKILKGEQL